MGSEAGRSSDFSFPVRVAAVDVGSNAIRFKAAEFTDVDRYEGANQRIPVRLGHRCSAPAS